MKTIPNVIAVVTNMEEDAEVEYGPQHVKRLVLTDVTLSREFAGKPVVTMYFKIEGKTIDVSVGGDSIGTGVRV